MTGKKIYSKDVIERRTGRGQRDEGWEEGKEGKDGGKE